MWKAKALLELNLARNIKDNEKGFYKCMNSKRKIGKIWGHCWIRCVSWGWKTQIRQNYWMPYFHQFYCWCKPSRITDLWRKRNWRKEDIPLVVEGCRDSLDRVNNHKSMGPNEIHPWVLREIFLNHVHHWKTGTQEKYLMTWGMTVLLIPSKIWMTQETIGQSDSPPPLERWWNRLLWRLSPSM